VAPAPAPVSAEPLVSSSVSSSPDLPPEAAEAERPTEPHAGEERGDGKLSAAQPPKAGNETAEAPTLLEQAGASEAPRAAEPIGEAAIAEAPRREAGESPGTPGHRYGNGWATILDVRLEDRQGRGPVLVQSGESYRFVVEFVARKPLPSVCIGFLIRTSRGIDLIGTDTRFLAWPRAA
jgi:Wzt C-terminal domain